MDKNEAFLFKYDKYETWSYVGVVFVLKSSLMMFIYWKWFAVEQKKRWLPGCQV